MSNNWTTKWKKVLVWFSGYVNFIAFAIIGGYAIAKTEDEELHKSAKYAFAVTLIFTAFDAFLLLFSLLGGMSENWYGSSAYEFYNVLSMLSRLFKILVYAVCIGYVFLKSPDEGKEPKQVETKTEEKADEDSAPVASNSFDDDYTMF